MYYFNRLDFTKDMQILATLRDFNLVKMVALVEEEPFGAVFEYSQFGDLYHFLQSYEKRAANENDFRYNF